MVINLNGVKKDIPDCFERLTARQYEMLVPELAKEMEARDHFAMFNILAGTDFKDYHANSENEVTIWNAIRWIYEQSFTSTMPTVLKIEDKIITVPKKIKAMTIGQNIALRQLIEKSKYVEENICAACAIYLQPLIDGTKFNPDRVDDVKKVIEAMPAYLIRPIGFFLLTSALPRGNGQTNFLSRMKNNLTISLGRMLPFLQKSGGSIVTRTSR